MKSMKSVVFGMLVMSAATSSFAQSAFEKIKAMKQDRNTTKAALTAALASFTNQTLELVAQREDHMEMTSNLSEDVVDIGQTLQAANLTKKN